MKLNLINNFAPVILIGMHRSGTSMLAKALHQFGIFMGCSRTRNEECRWTNKLNYWIFVQASATWERPEGIQYLLDNPHLCELVQDYLQGVVSGPAALRYLGLRRGLKQRSLFRMQEPWGWKDPRNTFTLPCWLQVFPQARVLHITRHGVDVAHSLLKRHQQAVSQAARRYRKRRWLYVNNPLAPKRRGFAHNPRVSDLDGGLELWQIYMRRAQTHVQNLAPQAMELSYEDLLQNPVEKMQTVLDFCGLNVNVQALKNWSAQLKPDRAYAFRNNPELLDFARHNSHLLADFDYTP